MATPEGEIRDYLKQRVAAMGGEARKVRWEGRNGAPDWLVWVPPNVLAWAELKAPSAKPKAKQPTHRQGEEHAALRRMGFRVVVLDSLEAVEELLGERRIR